MSKGSPIVPIRVPAELLVEVDRYVSESADSRKGEPWSRSSFIVTAIRDKLFHLERGRSRSRARSRARLQARVDGLEGTHAQ